MDTIRTSLSLAFALAVGLLVWTGCDSNTSSEATSGKMTLRLTDAPADSATAVNVTITRIALVPGDVDDDDSDNGDSDDNGDDESDADEDGFVDVYNPDTPQTINLLDYQDSSVELANGADVPEGEYNQMRLFLSANQNANTIEFGDQTYELKTPSAPQSGYKINIPGFEVDENSDRISLTLDFDASQSVVKAGGSGMYILKPVIRPENVQFNDGSLETPDVTSTGLIDGFSESDSTITVEGVQFDVTADTEYEDVSSFSELTSNYTYAGVEAVEAGDGSYDATYLEAIADSDKRFALEGPLTDTAEQDSLLTFFSGTEVYLTPNSAPEEDVPSSLTVGNTYDVEFTKDESGNRLATEIESDD